MSRAIPAPLAAKEKFFLLTVLAIHTVTLNTRVTNPQDSNEQAHVSQEKQNNNDTLSC